MPIHCKSCLNIHTIQRTLSKTDTRFKPGVWEPNPIACTVCNRCGICGCVCIVCKWCHGHHKDGIDIIKHPSNHYCRTCGVCKSWCVCRNRPKHMPSHKFAKPPTRIESCFGPMLNTNLGIELELAEWGTLKSTLEYSKHIRYNIVHDGSVKPSGQELVLMPLKGDAFLSGMLELSTNLSLAKASVNKTCGLHVHVDATYVGVWEIKNLIKLYSRLEPEIFKRLCAEWRTSDPVASGYCKLFPSEHSRTISALNTTKDLKAYMLGMFYKSFRPYGYMYFNELKAAQTFIKLESPKCTTITMFNNKPTKLNPKRYGVKYLYSNFNDLKEDKASKYNQNRYYALNLHSFFHRGTIEFRHREATTDPWELVCWPQLCAWLVKLSGALNTQQLESIKTLADLGEHLPNYLRQWLKIKGI